MAKTPSLSSVAKQVRSLVKMNTVYAVVFVAVLFTEISAANWGGLALYLALVGTIFQFTKSLAYAVIGGTLVSVPLCILHVYNICRPIEGFTDGSADEEPFEGEEDEEEPFEGEGEGEGPAEEEDAEEDEELFVDAGSTFLKAYKNLSPEAMKAMSSQTKELMSTQKALLETLSTFGPVMKETMGVMDNFKGLMGKGA